MNDLIKIMEPIFEGSIEPGGGYVREGVLYSRVCREDLQGLLCLESHWPVCLRLSDEDVEKDLEYFPQLQVMAKDLQTKQPLGKASIVLIDPGDDDLEAMVKGEGGWYEAYQKRSPHGRFHEATGIVIDREYQVFRRRGIDITLCLVLARALVENTLKGDAFERLTWSSSNHLFPRYVAKHLRLPPNTPLFKISEVYLALDEPVRLELHHRYVDAVLKGVLKDIPLNLHAAVVKHSEGLIKVTDKNVQCPEDIQSLGMGTRFNGTEVINFLVEWKKTQGV